MFSKIGFAYDGKNSFRSNSIFILDVGDQNDYKWVVEFDPNAAASTSPPSSTTPTSDTLSQQSTSTKQLGIIIGGTVGGGVIIIGSIVFLIYYRKRKSSVDYIPTPGNVRLNDQEVIQIPGSGHYKK